MGNSTYYLRDASGKEVTVFDGRDWTYYYYGRDRLGSLKGNTLSYFTYDHLGSLRVDYSLRYDATTKQLTYTANALEDYYAFGKVLRSFETNAARFMYTGKERDRELSEDYFGARKMDNEVCRWPTPDALAGLYYNMSPYAFVANNPIRLIEIDGRYFEEGSFSAKQANRIESQAEKQANRLERKANKLEAKGKSIGDLRDRVAELRKSVQDIKDMHSDQSTEYKYGTVDSEEARTMGLTRPSTISTDKNAKGDNVVTMFTEQNMGSILHETRHGGQNVRGEFNITTGIGYGVSDEVSAYRAQYSWEGQLQYRDQPSESLMLQRMKGGQAPTMGIITNINQINGNIVNSMVDPGFISIYPPPSIPLSIWNNN